MPLPRLTTTPLIGLAAILGLAAAACSGSDHPTATAPSTTAPSAAITSPSFDSKPDPAAQARLHVVLADHHGPTVDLFVNGAIAVNGGQQQVNIPAGYVTAYLYLAPGTHHVALAPTGTGLAQALAAPVDVPVVAGHRYLVAYMGEVDAGTLKPLVIDESAEAANIGAAATDAVTVTLNNVVGSSGLDYQWAGVQPGHDIPYGGYQTAVVPAGEAHITMTVKGATAVPVIDEDNYALPGDSDFGITGHDAASKDTGVIDAAPTTDLNVLDSLRLFDPQHLLPGSHFPSFATVLAAIQTAGLTDLYTKDGPVLFLVPTDKAFAALPAAQRDALLADPAALADMLRTHTISGYVPRGSLAQTPGGSFDRTFTNLEGDTIRVGNDYIVNGAGAGDYASLFTADGSQFHPVDTLSFATAP